MNLILLKITQQVVNLLMLGDKVYLAQKLLPAPLVAVVDVWQQIFYIECALDIIQILVIDRNTRVARLDDDLLDLLERSLDIQRGDVNSGAHNLLHLGIDEVDDTRQHLMLLTRGTLRQIHRICQLLHRDILGAGSHTAQSATRTHQHIRQRVAYPAEHLDWIDHITGKAVGVALRQDLW